MKIKIGAREIYIPNYILVNTVRELGLDLGDELKKLIAKVYEAGFRDPVEIAEVVREITD